MKFKFAAPLLFIILFSNCYTTIIAQEMPNGPPTVKSLNKFKLYVLGIGIEREQQISNSSTIYFGAAIETVAPFYPKQPSNASDIIRIDYSINFAPILSLGFRNYFNLSEKENLKRKQPTIVQAISA